jgi:hypothetical protein
LPKLIDIDSGYSKILNLLAIISTILINNLHQIKNYFYAVFCRKLLKESLLPSITYPRQEFLARPGKNNPVAGKVI